METVPAQILEAVAQAAEKTAQQAQGNDQRDWTHFAKAVRALKVTLPEPPPVEQPPDTPPV